MAPDWSDSKLDGVSPVDNRPSIDKLHHFVKEREKIDMWHLVEVNILSKFLLPCFYALGCTVSWIFWTKGSLNERINELMNYKGFIDLLKSST